MSSKLRCLVATGNPNKTIAIKRILADLPIELVDLSAFDPIEEPVEDGDTFLANALIKSRYYCEKTGLISLADDSGLEVDALDKQPGIYSARYAGVDSSYSVKMGKILTAIKDVPMEKRTARFMCVACATFPDGREFHANGALEGVIGEAPRGEGGFGYDPIVYLPELGKSVAEISAAEKDKISHRGEAFRKLAGLLPL